MKDLRKVFKNRYIFFLAVFAFWMLFLDQDNLFRQLKLSKELKNAKEQQEFYRSEYRKDSTLLYQLENDDEVMEKLAREKYLMKKDDETIFLIIDEDDEK
jgi:cell division protein FtsB